MIGEVLTDQRNCVWRLFHDDCASQDLGCRAKGHKIIQVPFDETAQDLECNVKMPVIKTVSFLIGQYFVVASSTSALSFFSNLLNLYYMLLSVVCGHCHRHLSLLHLGTSHGHLCSISALCGHLSKLKAAMKGALSCTSWLLFCVKYVHTVWGGLLKLAARNCSSL